MQTSTFLADECGAVIVDWVVLTAGLVALTLSVFAFLSEGVESASQTVYGELDQGVRTYAWGSEE